MKNKFRSLVVIGIGLSIALGSANAAVPVSDLPDLSLLTPYALFGNNINLNLATVNGDVGVSANGNFKMSSPSFITGRLKLESGVTSSIANPGHVSNGIQTGASLSAAQAEVFSASLTLQALPADFTLGNVTTAQNFNSTGDVTVIDINSLNLGGSNNITLTGDANDFFVLNIAHGVAFGGSAGIFGAGGVNASHILINLYDNGGNLGVVAHINDMLNGTILIPYDAATFHSENGAIYGGNGQITLMSGATINSIPFVPEAPTTSLIVFGGLLVLGVGLRRRNRSKA